MQKVLDSKSLPEKCQGLLSILENDQVSSDDKQKQAYAAYSDIVNYLQSDQKLNENEKKSF